MVILSMIILWEGDAMGGGGECVHYMSARLLIFLFVCPFVCLCVCPAPSVYIRCSVRLSERRPEPTTSI